MLENRLHGSSILIIILVLASRSSAVNLQTMCRGHAYGTLLPNPQDCSSYYVCDAETQLLYCDHGLHFDRINKVCNWPFWAGCVLQDVENDLPAETDNKEDASETEVKHSEVDAQLSNEHIQSADSKLLEAKPDDVNQTEKELGQPTDREDPGAVSQLDSNGGVISQSNSENKVDEPEDPVHEAPLRNSTLDGNTENLLLPELSKEQASLPSNEKELGQPTDSEQPGTLSQPNTNEGVISQSNSENKVDEPEDPDVRETPLSNSTLDGDVEKLLFPELSKEQAPLPSNDSNLDVHQTEKELEQPTDSEQLGTLSQPNTNEGVISQSNSENKVDEPEDPDVRETPLSNSTLDGDVEKLLFPELSKEQAPLPSNDSNLDVHQTEKELEQPTDSEQLGTLSQPNTNEGVISQSNSENKVDEPEDPDVRETPLSNSTLDGDVEKLLFPELSKEQAPLPSNDSNLDVHQTEKELEQPTDSEQLSTLSQPNTNEGVISQSNSENKVDEPEDLDVRETPLSNSTLDGDVEKLLFPGLSKEQAPLPSNNSNLESALHSNSVETHTFKDKILAVQVAVAGSSDKVHTSTSSKEVNVLEHPKDKIKVSVAIPVIDNDLESIKPVKSQVEEVTNVKETLEKLEIPNVFKEEPQSTSNLDEPLNQLSEKQVSKDSNTLDTSKIDGNIEKDLNSEVSKDQVNPVEIDTLDPPSELEGSKDNILAIEVPVAGPKVTAAPSEINHSKNLTEVIKVSVGIPNLQTPNASKPFMNSSQTVQVPVIVSGQHSSVLHNTSNAKIDSAKPSGVIVEVPTLQVIFESLDSENPLKNQNLVKPEDTKPGTPLFIPVSVGINPQAQSASKQLDPHEPQEAIEISLPAPQVGEKALTVLQSPSQVIELKNAFETEAVAVKVESQKPSNQVIELVNPVQAQNGAPEALVGTLQLELVGEKMDTQKQSSPNIIELPAPHVVSQAPFIEPVVEKVESVKPTQSPTNQVIILPNSVSVSNHVDDNVNAASVSYVQAEVVAEKVELPKPEKNKNQVIDLPSPTIPIEAYNQIEYTGAHVQAESVVAEKVELSKPAQNKNQVIELQSPAIPIGVYSQIEDTGAHVQAESVVAEKVEISKPAQNKNQVIELQAPVYAIETSNPIAQNMIPNPDLVVEKISVVSSSRPAQGYNPPVVTENPNQTKVNSVKEGFVNKFKPMTNSKDELLVGLYYQSLASEADADQSAKEINKPQENSDEEDKTFEKSLESDSSENPSDSVELPEKKVIRPHHKYHPNSNIFPTFGGHSVSAEDPASASEETYISSESVKHSEKNIHRPNHHHHPNANFLQNLGNPPASFEDPTSANEEDLQNLPHETLPNHKKKKPKEDLTRPLTPNQTKDQESESLDERDSVELSKKQVKRPYHHHRPTFVGQSVSAEDPTSISEDDIHDQSFQTKNKVKNPDFKPSKVKEKKPESVKSEEFTEEDVAHILVPEYALSKLPESAEDLESNKHPLDESLESLSTEEQTNIPPDFAELTEKEVMKPSSNILQSFENFVEDLTLENQAQQIPERPSPSLSKDALIKELEFKMPEEVSNEGAGNILTPAYEPIDASMEDHSMHVESLDGISSKPVIHSTNHHLNLLVSILSQPSFEVDGEINRQIVGAHDTETGKPIDVMYGYDSKNVQCLHDGLYFLPHPSSCVQYFICAYRHLHLHTCGSDLIWNYKREQCELETDTRCYSNEATIPLEPTPGSPPDAAIVSTARPYPMPPVRTTQFAEVTSSEDTMAPICPPFRQVYLPNFHDCNKYYICILGEPVLTSCPDNMHWDSMLEFCGEPSVAECAVL